MTTDLIYVGILAALLIGTWGLMRICELPPESSKSVASDDQKIGGKS